jgi:hypothetical protein
MAAPSFKARFNLEDDAFHAMTAKMDVLELSRKLHMPYFVMAGEDDLLGNIAYTVEHLNNVPGPKTLMLYAGEEHGVGGARSAQLSAPFFSVIADWLFDRANRKPIESTYNLVDRTGRRHTEPWSETKRTYQYGAPLGVSQLLSDDPPVGLS